MKRPTLAEAGRFILIVFGVLLIEKLVRVAVFEGPREQFGGGDIVIAIAVAIIVTGGWIGRTRTGS